jgi:anti-sigma factor ChrR (cupin superfamily)
MWLAWMSAETGRWVAITLQKHANQNKAVRIPDVPIQAVLFHSLWIMPGGCNAIPSGH